MCSVTRDLEMRMNLRSSSSSPPLPPEILFLLSLLLLPLLLLLLEVVVLGARTPIVPRMLPTFRRTRLSVGHAQQKRLLDRLQEVELAGACRYGIRWGRG